MLLHDCFITLVAEKHLVGQRLCLAQLVRRQQRGELRLAGVHQRLAALFGSRVVRLLPRQPQDRVVLNLQPLLGVSCLKHRLTCL